MGNEPQKGDTAITWTQLKVGIPIVLTLLGILVTVVLGYAAIQSDIRSVKEHQEGTDGKIKEIKDDINGIKANTDEIGKDIVQIKTVLGVPTATKPISRVFVTPSPEVAKQETGAVPANQQQSQTIIAQANPTPVPSPSPIPNPTQSTPTNDALIPAIINPSILDIDLKRQINSLN